MKKTRKFLIFMLCTFAAVSGAIVYMNKPLALKADSVQEEEVEGVASNDYEHYLDEQTKYHNEKHPGAPLTPQGDPVVIYGEDYDETASDRFAQDGFTVLVKKIAVGEDYKKSQSALNGRTNLGLQDGGNSWLLHNVFKLFYY